MLAGFDVDGVVADFPNYIGGLIDIDPKIISVRGQVEEVDKQIRAIMSIPGTWVNLPVMDGAKSALSILKRAKVPVVFISSIHVDMAPLRYWWLERHFGKYLPDGVLFYPCPMEYKAALAKQCEVTHFLEDTPSIAASFVPQGIKSFLMPGQYVTPVGVEVVTLEQYARRIANERREAAGIERGRQGNLSTEGREHLVLSRG